MTVRGVRGEAAASSGVQLSHTASEDTMLHNSAYGTAEPDGSVLGGVRKLSSQAQKRSYLQRKTRKLF